MKASNYRKENQSIKIKKTMKSLSIVSIFILSGIFLSSCDWNISRTVIGSGDVESEERAVSEFSGVTVTGRCDVDITTGDSYSLVLHAQPQVLDVMTSRVRSGVLHLGFDSNYNVKTHEEISATIIVPSLDFVSITGEGNFVIRGDEMPRLNIVITGSGNVEAYGMEVLDCNISITGAGNCEVSVRNELDVQISGVGNVYYQGNPELRSDISGVGNLIAVDP